MAKKTSKQKGIHRNPNLEEENRATKFIEKTGANPYVRNKSMIIKAIAEDTDIRESVVRTVLDRFTDISIEALANGEYLSWPYIMSVHEITRNMNILNTTDTNNPNSRTVVTKTTLQPRMHQGVKKLHRAQIEHFPDQPYIINRDTWRGALDWIENSPEYKNAKRSRFEEEANNHANSFHDENNVNNNSKIDNPLLDNEDE